MYKFHITGFAATKYNAHDSDHPVDITVYSDSEQNALDKAKLVFGYPVDGYSRKIVVEEILESENVVDIIEIKQQAYKEFAEKLTDKLLKYDFISDSKYHVYYCSDVQECIDKILKELENK